MARFDYQKNFYYSKGLERMIRLLTIDDWNKMKEIIEETEYLEGLGMPPEVKQKLIGRIYARLIWTEQVSTFGFFHEDQLLAFFQFLEWPNGQPNNQDNYSIWHSFSKKTEEIKRVIPEEGRKKLLTKLLDHAVEFMTSKGRKVAWVNCPKDREKSIRWYVLEHSILKNKNFEVVEEIPPGAKTSTINWVWLPDHRKTRQIIKIT